MSTKRQTCEEAMSSILGSLALGTVTLPGALRAMWDAGRGAERIDTLLMEKAQRESKRTRRTSRRETT